MRHWVYLCRRHSLPPPTLALAKARHAPSLTTPMRKEQCLLMCWTQASLSQSPTISSPSTSKTVCPPLSTSLTLCFISCCSVFRRAHHLLSPEPASLGSCAVEHAGGVPSLQRHHACIRPCSPGHRIVSSTQCVAKHSTKHHKAIQKGQVRKERASDVESGSLRHYGWVQGWVLGSCALRACMLVHKILDRGGS